ncbi:MAG: TMEM165/GDT1 family protein [Merismopedia sp. SIO2A8]|nr:TMEM165/GDT1 family protein [Symploca sp. SIO2B6]NET52929.1 TMEM165/GDT1 family protein [Merismopedia sp. SIO2A8]
MLTGFTAGLLLITLSELGDKTFFIGAILATRHSRRWVFVGVTTALFVMTVLSVSLGQVASIIPPHYVKWTAIALFLGFGGKLIYDAICMDGGCGMGDEQTAALAAIQDQAPVKAGIHSGRTIVLKAFTLTFVAEWGDRTQFATVTLSTAHHPLGVTLGATLGHAICAAIAILCGTFIAGKISERWLTAVGGSLFILFGIFTALDLP